MNPEFWNIFLVNSHGFSGRNCSESDWVIKVLIQRLSNDETKRKFRKFIVKSADNLVELFDCKIYSPDEEMK